MDIFQTLDLLIDRWCERRAIRPLQLLLRRYPGPLFHTDQKFELLNAMKDVKQSCKAELTEEEYRLLLKAIQSLGNSLP